MSEKKVLSIRIVAQRTGVSPSTVRRYIRRGLVRRRITEADLVELRRIRRLTELGANLAGIEMILHMRRQIAELRAALAQGGSSKSLRGPTLIAHREEQLEKE